jgi:cellulose synthase/poly-beta-1,6-N-acetylglucosamine synthase-like glycosyltransferase
VDADTEVTPNLLRAFAARITQGEHAVQSHYGVLNPWDSWRTQLVTIAMAAFHIVRSRTRERLGVSSGIRGNGWCLTCDLLRKVPYRAYSLAEDLEFGITLGLAGFRVAYADDAHVYGEMVSSASVAQRQRQRWESGRFELIRSQTPRLLAAALRRRSGVCLELALDLLLLPLSYLVMGIGLFTAAAVVLSPWSRFAAFWLWAAGACILILAAHVLRGWQVSGLGARGLLTLARVPGFLVWKILLSGRSKPTEWVRTDRESR